MSDDPDWAMYRTLLAVLDEGSLSAAARRLGLTQPTVARHVDALEAALSGNLFVRSRRGLEATDRQGAPPACRGHGDSRRHAASDGQRCTGQSGRDGTD